MDQFLRIRSSWGLMLAASSLDARNAVVAVIVALVLAVIVAVVCQIAGIVQGPLLAALTFQVSASRGPRNSPRHHEGLSRQ